MNDGVQSQGDGAMVDIDYALIVDTSDGSASLTCGGEVMWSSIGDQAYADEFGEEPLDIDDEDATAEVFDWLVEQGYAPAGVEYDVIEADDNFDMPGA